MPDEYDSALAELRSSSPPPPPVLTRRARGAEKLQGVRPDLLDHWNNLQSEFERNGLTPIIKSGFRTAEQQHDLHVRGYPTKGNDGYINISPHQEGRALDVGFPAEQKAKGRQILQRYAQYHNLYQPGDEPWHIAVPKAQDSYSPTTQQPATPQGDEYDQALQELRSPTPQPEKLLTPRVTSRVVDPTDSQPAPPDKPKPIEFKPGYAEPEPLSLNPVENLANALNEPEPQLPSGLAGLQARKYQAPDSHLAGERVTIPFSAHLTPSEDDAVKGYLSTLGPKYVQMGEKFKKETGQNILNLQGGMKQNRDGSFNVRPTKGSIDFINAYVQSGGDLSKAKAEAERQAAEYQAAQQKALEESKPDVKEAQAAMRKGRESDVVRGITSGAIGPAQAFGTMLPGSAGNELQRESAVMKAASQELNKESPAPSTGQQIKRGIGSLIPNAMMLGVTAPLGVAQLPALGALEGTTPKERLQGGLQGAVAQGVLGATPAAFTGAGLPTTGKLATGGALVGQPAFEAVQRGESPVQAITENLPFAALPFLHGKGDAEKPTELRIDQAENTGVQGRGALDAERTLANREAVVRPAINPETVDQMGAAQTRRHAEQQAARDLAARPTIERPTVPDGGDPRFANADNAELQRMLDAKIRKGTSRETRAAFLGQQQAAKAELLYRQTATPLEPVQPRGVAEVPESDIPSFREYVENRPGGGLRFETLEPDSAEYGQLAREYTERYGTKAAPHAPESSAEALEEAPQRVETPVSQPDQYDHALEELRTAAPPLAEPPAPAVIRRSRKPAPPVSLPVIERAAQAPARPETGTPSTGPRELRAIEPLSLGRESQAATERGSEISTRYAIVDLEHLVTSHDSGLRPNPEFPPELQPRERDRAASAEQINRIASQLRPEFLAESPKASEGAPIVGADGIVESGNGRVLGLRQAYEANNRGSQAYRRFLLENAERLGLDREAITDAKSPVLVRLRTSNVDRAQFVKEANEQSITSMSSVEQARSDAQKLKGNLLDLFRPSDSGEIATAGNMDFIRAFMKEAVGPNELNRLVTASGQLSQEGVARVRNAVFARAYGDSPEGLTALEKLAESTDNNVRNITSAMLRNAPAFASLKEGIVQGTRYPLDLAPDVAAAMSKLSSLREQGMPVADYLRQGALYGEDLSPTQKRILQAFDDNKRGAATIDAILKNYVRGANAAGSPTQGGLFGTEIPTKADFLEAAIQEALHGPGVQDDLFSARNQRLQSEPAARGANPEVNARVGAVRSSPDRVYSAAEITGETRRPVIHPPDPSPDPSGEDQGYPLGRFDSLIDRLTTQEEAARQRLAERGEQQTALIKERGGEAGATTIPQDIYDYVVIGASKLARRSLNVAQFVDEMVREFGDSIRENARLIFKHSQKMVADTQKQIRMERLSKEIADRLFTENVPRDMQREALKIAARFRTSTDTQGRFMSGFKSRVGEMAKSYGAAGGELTNRLHLGDIARAHEMEAGHKYLSRIQDVYDGVKNDFERQRISDSVINALEDRANADRHLDTPAKQAVFNDTKAMLDEFRQKLSALGYKTREDYFTHIRDVDILDQIISDAKDPRDANLNDLVAAKSGFLKVRHDAQMEIRRDLPRVLFAYLKSVTKEIAYGDAVEYYYDHFADDIPISLRKNSTERAIKLMQNSLQPEQGRGRFYRVAGMLRNEQYRNFLAYNLKASAQNFTQVDFAKMRWTKEATDLSSKLWRSRKTLTGPLADAIDIASTEQTPLMRFLEQFKGDEPSGSQGRFSEAFNRYDPFQKSEKRNWALSELGSIVNSVVKRPEYKSLRAKGTEPIDAINEMLGKKDVFDLAVREAATTAAETQVASNPAMRGEFYDAPLHRIIGMFTAFKTRQLQILGEALRRHEGINGARAQTILRRGLSGDAQPVEVLREVEAQRRAMEKMVDRADKFREDIGIPRPALREMVQHLKGQEKELNGMIRQIEPLSGSRARSARVIGKYFAKVAAISVFFNLFWDSVYTGIAGKEDDKDADDRVSTAVRRAFWDVLPSPFYGADPSKFLVSPIAPNFERSAPFGHITRRGVVRDVVSYGSSVIPFAGVVDRVTNRRASGAVVDLIAPKKERSAGKQQ